MARRSSMAVYPAAASASGELEVEHLAGVDLAVPDAVDEVGQEPAHGGGAAVEVDLGEEQLVAGKPPMSWETPTQPTWPPGRVEPMACIIDSWVPTASMTECAPSPSAAPSMRATPSSPRSSTMSVAPDSRPGPAVGVTAHRDDALGTELAGGEDAEQADGAVTDDGDSLARSDLGGDGGEPAGAEDVGGGQQAGHQLVVRHAGGGDEGAVGVGDAGVFGLGADGAVDELGVQRTATGSRHGRCRRCRRR